MKLSEITKERIERTCRRLDKVKDEHFYIATWYDPKGNKPAVLDEKSCLLDEGFCGSTACVLGTAALIKDFNKLGLKIKFKTEPNYWGEIYHDVVFEDENGAVWSGTEAGARFFGIPYDHADLLFYTLDTDQCKTFYGIDSDDDESLITPRMVAAKLREYIATDGRSVERYLEELEGDYEEEEEEEEYNDEPDDVE